MLKIPLVTWIANAAVGLSGLYGDVTRQARLADCSRQTIYDHAHKVQAAVEDAHDGGPTRGDCRVSTGIVGLGVDRLSRLGGPVVVR